MKNREPIDRVGTPAAVDRYEMSVLPPPLVPVWVPWMFVSELIELP